MFVYVCACMCLCVRVCVRGGQARFGIHQHWPLLRLDVTLLRTFRISSMRANVTHARTHSFHLHACHLFGTGSPGSWSRNVCGKICKQLVGRFRVH